MIRGLNPTRRHEEAASRVSISSQPAWTGSACANARGGAVTAGSGRGQTGSALALRAFVACRTVCLVAVVHTQPAEQQRSSWVVPARARQRSVCLQSEIQAESAAMRCGPVSRGRMSLKRRSRCSPTPPCCGARRGGTVRRTQETWRGVNAREWLWLLGSGFSRKNALT